MQTFADLVESRKTWIDEVLRPWCQRAPRMQLRLAELEWQDVAGRVEPEKTLWMWAWSRFPDLVHAELSGIDETRPVTVQLHDGTLRMGYPDARQSQQGQLVLLCRADNGPGFQECGPFSLDDIAAVTRA